MRLNAGELRKLAMEMRIQLLQMIVSAKTCHVGVVFSELEILLALYFGGILKVDPDEPDWPERDRFILSKGHGCSAFYLTLARRGFCSVEKVMSGLCANGSHFIAQVNHFAMPGVEVSTGALGHGLGVGVGMALAAKIDNARHRIFVLAGDGELNEGSCWESILQAAHHGLDNLTVIVDRNGLQAYGRTEDVLKLESLSAKWQAFNWAVRTVNGHDADDLVDALDRVPFETGKPSVVIAETVKGKGVSFMENQVQWHYKTPTLDEMAAAVEELKLGGEQ